MAKKAATKRRARNTERGEKGPPRWWPAWEGPSSVSWRTPRVGEPKSGHRDPQDQHLAAQHWETTSIARIARSAGEEDTRDATRRATAVLFWGAARPVLFWICVGIVVQASSALNAVKVGMAHAVEMQSSYVEVPLDEFCRAAQKILPDRHPSGVREIASFLLETRRAQVSTAHHVDLAIVQSKLLVAQSELKRRRWAATKVRQRARIEFRKDNPRASEATIDRMVESDPAVLEADGLHFFSRGIRERYADSFNGLVTGLSTPQSKIGADWQNSFVPLVAHVLRYDAKLELQEIADLVDQAQLVRVSREDGGLTLDYVSKVLSRSEHQR